MSSSRASGKALGASAPSQQPQLQNGKAQAPSQQSHTQNGKAHGLAQRPHSQNGKATKLAPQPDPEFVEYDEHEESFTDEDDHDEDAPTTGRELLGWARRQPEDAFHWLVKTGKKLRFPERILDWSQEQVGNAYAAYRRANNN
ncbi:MAG: hypothetical protein ACLQVF_04180 [Isosphaeraceae bacterium]